MTDQVSWLPPQHPRAKVVITETDIKSKLNISQKECFENIFEKRLLSDVTNHDESENFMCVIIPNYTATLFNSVLQYYDTLCWSFKILF